MVQKSMERLSSANNRARNKIGAIILGVSLLLGNEQAANTVEPPRQITKNLISPFVYDALDSQMLAGVVRDPETNEFVTVKDEIPSPRNEAFHEGLNSPISQLGRANRVVDTIIVTRSGQENGYYYSRTKSILMEINPLSGSMLRNPRVVPKLFDHETTHALNDEWYEYLSTKNTPENPSLAVKIARVSSTCIAMNKLILSDFVDENREQIASSFENAEKSIRSFHFPTDPLSKDPQHPMTNAADAIRENNPVIYDISSLCDPQVAGIDISSIAYSFSDQSEKNLGADLMYRLSLTPIQNELDLAAKEAFACITEGKALSELLNDTSPLEAGHPQDNPTEMGSSVITTLSSNPEYFVTCANQMPQELKQALFAYVSAELDIMEYTNPQLITILRSNPEVSEIIDNYIVIDKQ
jgi:hypothetical protein